MTMFNITDGKNNISRDKPIEHIDKVIGLHVQATTSPSRGLGLGVSQRDWGWTGDWSP